MTLRAQGNSAHAEDLQTYVPVADTEVVSTLEGGGRRGYRVGSEEAAGGQIVPVAVDFRNGVIDGEVTHTLQAEHPGPNALPHVLDEGEAFSETGIGHWQGPDDTVGTLAARDYKQARAVVARVEPHATAFHMIQDPISSPEVTPALGSSTYGMGVGIEGDDEPADPMVFDIYNHTVEAEGVSHTLRDGHGVGQPLVAYPIQDGRAVEKGQNGLGVGDEDDPAYTVDTVGAQAVAVEAHGLAFNQRDEARIAEDTAYALQTAPGGDEQLVAYTIRADAMREGTAKTPSADAEGKVRLRDPGMGLYEDVAPTLDTGQAHGVAYPLAMRGRAEGAELEMGEEGVYNALRAGDGGSSRANLVAYGIGSDAVDRSGEGADGTAAARSGLNITEEVQPTLRARPNNSVATTYVKAQKAHDPDDCERWEEADATPTLDAGGHAARTATAVVEQTETLRSHPRPGSNTTGPLAIGGMQVRRLTPLECERLQGFPDGHTADRSDSARYRMIGNAVCVAVSRWIGQRLVAVHRGEAL